MNNKTKTAIGLVFISALVLTGAGCGEKKEKTDKEITSNVNVETSGDIALDSIQTEPAPAAGTDTEDSENTSESTSISGQYTADISQSSLFWKGYKPTSSHEGTIDLQSGSVTIEDGIPTAAEFVVNMGTIICTDNQSPSLLNHLKSEDFFDVANHQTASFKLTKAEKASSGYTITGDLTIKGITKPVTFPAKITSTEGQAKASGTMSIDRTAYDIKYRSGSFFSDLGDSLIKDEFELTIDLVATK